MFALIFPYIFELCLLINYIEGHGRLVDPPARGTMWRLGFDTPPNYNDHQLFCGGYSRQWIENEGRCGECGDPWDIPRPRPNEAGGMWGTGTIAKAYREGQVITSTVHLTANHQGWFEFRLCSNNDPKQYVKQSCLNKHVLKLADHPGTRYEIKHTQRGLFRIRLELPKGLTCSQCVFQWHYTTGNNWGFCKDGANRAGCGAQEVFRGCSDVAVFSINDPNYFQFLNLTTDADLEQFLDQENNDDNHDHDHDDHRGHHNNAIDTDGPNVIIHNQLEPFNIDDSILFDSNKEPHTPKTPILKNSFNINGESLRNPNYFNENNLLRKKIEIYNKYISTDSFRKGKGAGNPSYKRIDSNNRRHKQRQQNRPPSSQIVWNHLTTESETTTPHQLLDNSPQILNALAAIINQPPSSAVTADPIKSPATTNRPPNDNNLPLILSAPSPETLTDEEVLELSRLLGINRNSKNRLNQDEMIFQKVIPDTTTPQSQHVTRRNRIPIRIPAVNQLALLPHGQKTVNQDTKPNALAFQVPLSELNNGGTLEKILMVQRAFGMAANSRTNSPTQTQQDSPLVFIVV